MIDLIWHWSFLDSLEMDAFSTYIQGRACLAANDALTAAMLFKRAAFGIGMYPEICIQSPVLTNLQDIQTQESTLITVAPDIWMKTERNLLNAGIPEYYSHIVTLFDKAKNFSFVIDFARLSLQFINPAMNEHATQLRTEMHSRLFKRYFIPPGTTSPTPHLPSSPTRRCNAPHCAR